MNHNSLSDTSTQLNQVKCWRRWCWDDEDDDEP